MLWLLLECHVDCNVVCYIWSLVSIQLKQFFFFFLPNLSSTKGRRMMAKEEARENKKQNSFILIHWFFPFRKWIVRFGFSAWVNMSMILIFIGRVMFLCIIHQPITSIGMLKMPIWLRADTWTQTQREWGECVRYSQSRRINSISDGIFSICGSFCTLSLYGEHGVLFDTFFSLSLFEWKREFCFRSMALIGFCLALKNLRARTFFHHSFPLWL